MAGVDTRVRPWTLPPSPSEYIDLCPDLSLLVELARTPSAPRPSQTLRATSYLHDGDTVASSIVIGQGTSFLVTRKTVPPLQQSWDPSKPKGGVSIQREREESVKPGHVIVYKIARVRFDDQGDPVPGHRVALASIVLDLMVLSHKPVLDHPNIIRLLGLAWGNNGFPDSCPMPVLMTEHADMGNLADYQTKNALTFPQKLDVLLDVAVGVDFLHQCSITHGDVKSENVLLFSDQSRGLIAKISDFGFAVLGDKGHFNFLPRGTLLWAAPEIRNRTLRVEEAPFSDVYSFGLLFWRVMIDGSDPLCSYFLRSDKPCGKAPPSPKDLQRLSVKDLELPFSQDYLGGRALPSVWLRKYWALTLSQKAELDKHSKYQHLLECMGKVHLNDETHTAYETVMKCALTREPSRRNLRAVIAALGYVLYSKPEQATVDSPEPKSIMMRDGYHILQQNSYSLSWNALRIQAPPTVCCHIMKQKLCKVAAWLSAGEENVCNLAFGLACCLVSGMGSDRYIDIRRARELLLSAANNGSTGAQAAIPRFCGAFGGTFNGLKEILTRCAQWGSLAALEDLPKLDQKSCQQAKSFLRTNMCGIGAQLFRYWNPPWNMARLKDLAFVENYLDNSPEPAHAIQINPRGDGLLHAAASLAQLDTVKRLVQHYKINVNQQNQQGETALHGAMRSGNIDIADWLLEHAAEVPTETTYSHETPLHWLISVEPGDAERMAERLLRDGASQRSLTVWAERCQYASTLVSGYKDKWDNLTYGTPLHWAICRKRLDLVHILLTHGAGPQLFGSSESNKTAFELAAFLHENEILRAMIDFKHPEPRFPWFDLGCRDAIHKESTFVSGGSIPYGLSIWIEGAIRGCDGWKMVFRHAENAKQKKEETFKILGYELSYAHLNEGVGDDRDTPLGFAARHGFHEAVEMILAHMNGQADINEQRGVESWSPVCWAIRRDNKRMFRDLMAHGADVHLQVSSPSRKAWLNWTLLHVAARSVIDSDLEICTKLLDLGLAPDGVRDPAYGGPPQTPLAVAIEENQFDLADLLRGRDANIDARCGYIHFQRTKLVYDCSILGCIVAANLRFSALRLKYLLWPTPARRAYPEPDFIVAHEFGFTALHIAVMGEDILHIPQERDADVASEILGLLLEKYEGAQEINAQSAGDLMTALHIAVQKSNLEAVQLLLDMDDIDVGIKNVAEQTAMDLAQDTLTELCEDGGKDEERVGRAEAILDLLKQHE